MNNANTPAFPIETAMYRASGLTKREHAAILLRVPQSGDDEIDAMIREANRRDAAGLAMQGYIAVGETSGSTDVQLAQYAIGAADALLAELEKPA